MCLKIDWASLYNSWKEIYRFYLCYFVSEGNFQVQAPWGAYIWRGDLTERFLYWECGGLIFGGAYTWRGLFSEFRLPATQATTHGRELLHSIMKTTDRRYRVYISTPL